TATSSVGHAGAGIFWDDAWLLVVTSTSTPSLEWKSLHVEGSTLQTPSSNQHANRFRTLGTTLLEPRGWFPPASNQGSYSPEDHSHPTDGAVRCRSETSISYAIQEWNNLWWITCRDIQFPVPRPFTRVHMSGTNLQALIDACNTPCLPHAQMSSPIARLRTGSPVPPQPTLRSQRSELGSHRSYVTTRGRCASTMIWRLRGRWVRTCWCLQVGCISSVRVSWR
ncbi:hypothetical protein L210DRAFT_3708687, partial [Boletus edulis BED1]